MLKDVTRSLKRHFERPVIELLVREGIKGSPYQAQLGEITAKIAGRDFKASARGIRVP
jgi:hypothetical protein